MRENKTDMVYLSQPLNALKIYGCHCAVIQREKMKKTRKNPILKTVNSCEGKEDLILPLTERLIEASPSSKQQKSKAG